MEIIIIGRVGLSQVVADLAESESSRSSGSSETGTECECTSSESCVSLLHRLCSPRPLRL